MDCQKYNIDVRDIYTRLMPYFYLLDEAKAPRTKLTAFLRHLAYMLQTTQNGIFAECQSVNTFLSYTGIHMSVEAFLNDTYDSTLRRITITENNVSQATPETWYRNNETDTEIKVWYTTAETDPDAKAWYTAGESSSSFNFTINIPLDVTYNEDTLRAQLSNYILAGKVFNINII
jgi:hypothetical protein